MSEPGWVYGCIIYYGPAATTKQYCELNQAAINRLPDKIDWQSNLLVKSMFSVLIPENRDDGFYRHQVIHFGASLNHLDYYWERWLNQFEALLRTLYWVEANVHIKVWGAGENSYYWEADIGPMFENPPQPIKHWEFKGWPRSWEPNRNY